MLSGFPQPLARKTQIHGGSMSHICVLLNIVLNWKQRAWGPSYLLCCHLLNGLCYSWSPLCTSWRNRASNLLTSNICSICISGTSRTCGTFNLSSNFNISSFYNLSLVIISTMLCILLAVKSTSLIINRSRFISIRLRQVIISYRNRPKLHFTIFRFSRQKHLRLGSLATTLPLWLFQNHRLGSWCLLVWSWLFWYVIYIQLPSIEFDILLISTNDVTFHLLHCAWIWWRTIFFAKFTCICMIIWLGLFGSSYACCWLFVLGTLLSLELDVDWFGLGCVVHVWNFAWDRCVALFVRRVMSLCLVVGKRSSHGSGKVLVLLVDHSDGKRVPHRLD